MLVGGSGSSTAACAQQSTYPHGQGSAAAPQRTQTDRVVRPYRPTTLRRLERTKSAGVVPSTSPLVTLVTWLSRHTVALSTPFTACPRFSHTARGRRLQRELGAASPSRVGRDSEREPQRSAHPAGPTPQHRHTPSRGPPARGGSTRAFCLTVLAIRSARGRRPSPQPWTGLRRRQGSGGVIGPIAKASNTNSRARPLLLPLPSSEARKPSPLLVNFSPSAGRGRRDRLRFRPLKLQACQLVATVPTHRAWRACRDSSAPTTPSAERVAIIIGNQLPFNKS